MHAAARTLRSEDVIRVTGQVVAPAEGHDQPQARNGRDRPAGQQARSAQQEQDARRSSRARPTCRPRNSGCVTASSTSGVQACNRRSSCGTKSRFSRASISTSWDFWKSKRPCWARARPKGRATTSFPAACTPASFYALPQSPQIYKQILMVAGYDRYMQIARCFRDEDLRADRQPEFTQIDVEMAFVEREDILNVIDGLMAFVAEKVSGGRSRSPCRAYGYHDVMERYGTDKPDLRFGMELVDVSEIARKLWLQRLQVGRREAGGQSARTECRRGRRKVQPQDDRRADAIRRPIRGEGPGVFPREGGLRSIRPSRNSSPRPNRDNDPAVRRPAGRPAVSRGRRQQVGHIGGAGRLTQPVGQGTQALRSERIESSLDSRLPALHLQRGRKTLGRRASSVLLPGARRTLPSSIQTPAACGPSRTTWW